MRFVSQGNLSGANGETFQGRRGLGNIYVWASGDGGEDDDCNCDGYAASMWTVSINSAINNGENAHYDESCSSTLASTFSNGAKDPHTGVVSVFLSVTLHNLILLQRTCSKRIRITINTLSIEIYFIGNY